MRLDKFLKVSRLIKRRTLAKEAAERGRILINEKVGKPASEVMVGDKLEILLGGRRLTVEVMETKENVRANEAASLYHVLADERVEQKTTDYELGD
ncbi:MAG: RNA-binding S4 domain-containing protein [Firmicutes bacterium]|jgi:ribosomal 50S subunit-recycling heat shock protein|nr:RNA-binding S4 domain-containing protein [Bacillota bacterium]